MDRMRDTSPHRAQAACCRNTRRPHAGRACMDDRPRTIVHAKPRRRSAPLPQPHQGSHR